MAQQPSLTNYPDLGEKVYEVVKSWILGAQLPPGSRLRVVDLAGRLGVSRTPVKDALNRLSAEGLVEEVPRRGYLVAALGEQDASELLDALLVLELAAVDRGIDSVDRAQVEAMQRLIAEARRCIDESTGNVDLPGFLSRDLDFHHLIVTSINNQHLVDAFRSLFLQLLTSWNVLGVSEGSGRALRTLEEHGGIVAALAAHDQASLRARLVDHHGNALQRSTFVLPR